MTVSPQPADFKAFMTFCSGQYSFNPTLKWSEENNGAAIPLVGVETAEFSSVAMELEALQSIYGEEALRLHQPAESNENDGSVVAEGDGIRVRYEAELP